MPDRYEVLCVQLAHELLADAARSQEIYLARYLHRGSQNILQYQFSRHMNAHPAASLCSCGLTAAAGAVFVLLALL